MAVNVSGLPISEAKGAASELRQVIIETLYPTSANMLADVCEGFGLAPGTRDEAFSSKRNYVMKRLLPLSSDRLLDLARQILTEFPNAELECTIQLASPSQLADSVISASLASFDPQGVYAIWTRALERRERDTEGAITLARTLLEEVCKHIIEGAGEIYAEKDHYLKDLVRRQRSTGASPRIERLLWLTPRPSRQSTTPTCSSRPVTQFGRPVAQPVPLTAR